MLHTYLLTTLCCHLVAIMWSFYARHHYYMCQISSFYCRLSPFFCHVTDIASEFVTLCCHLVVILHLFACDNITAFATLWQFITVLSLFLLSHNWRGNPICPTCCHLAARLCTDMLWHAKVGLLTYLICCGLPNNVSKIVALCQFVSILLHLFTVM